MTAPAPSVNAAAVSVCTFFFATMMVGCAVYETVLPNNATRRIALAEFAQVNVDAETTNEHSIAGVKQGSDSSPNAIVSEPVESEQSESSEAVSGAPQDRSRLAALEPGQVYIVDSLVGQINGRPVYADQFFGPLENQLIEERRRLSDIAFRDRAWEIIVTHLRTLIEDELFLAEAQASLKPEERQGLFAFMRYMRERTIAMGGGTLSGAQQRLEEMGEVTTIDQYVRGRLDEELIRRLLHEKIMPRVIVSWKDVEREYRRRELEFNPPPTIHLSRIRVSNDDQEMIGRVKSMLEADEPFSQIAQSIGQGDGTWQSFTVGPEGFHDIAISDAIKPYLQGLKVGDTTEPIVLASTTMWLHLAQFEQTRRDLYDLEVQRTLLRHLHNLRFHTEQTRYMESLLEDRVTSDLTVMARRLLEVALQRYGGPMAEQTE